jgi:hypothetical protein
VFTTTTAAGKIKEMLKHLIARPINPPRVKYWEIIADS